MSNDSEFLSIFIEEANDLLNQWEANTLTLDKAGFSSATVDALFRVAHNLKGSSRAVGLEEFGTFIHMIEDIINDVKLQKLPISKGIIRILLQSHNHLVNWLGSIQSGNSHYPAPQELLTSIETELLNQPMDSNPPTKAIEESRVEQMIELKPQSKIIEEPTVEPIQPNTTEKLQIKTPVQRTESLRISADRLDQIIQMIGELSIHQGIIYHTRNLLGEQGSKAMFDRAVNLSRKLTRELYEGALNLRMQPVQGLFQRLERIITDLGQELNKPVQIEIFGKEVDLDKSVLEKMVDPLTHIVRNAIDHGIEKPAERLAANKPEQGTIRISAHQNSTGVLVTVQDDGKGLNSEKLIQKAIEKGLISASERLTEKEAFKLILLPGFSTAEKITDISGRGVGMDVVKQSIESLSGSLEIESTLGKGSSFLIQLPTSLAIADGILFEIDHRTYVAPINALSEVIRLSDVKDHVKRDDKGEFALQLRGEIAPIHWLSHYLKSAPHKQSDSLPEDHVILVVRQQKRSIGLLVDRVISQQQIVMRPLSGALKNLAGLSGNTILGTGEPAMILDLGAISRQLLEKYKVTQHYEEKAA